MNLYTVVSLLKIFPHKLFKKKEDLSILEINHSIYQNVEIEYLV